MDIIKELKQWATEVSKEEDMKFWYKKFKFLETESDTDSGWMHHTHTHSLTQMHRDSVGVSKGIKSGSEYIYIYRV